ncbi:hypothetical protein ATO1_24105 [Phaeobacter sp. 22II1-1F12B]|nr:hypothetical protein ATO1_24105 [Phaeobacter sp. 22II1-1F12B]
MTAEQGGGALARLQIAPGSAASGVFDTRPGCLRGSDRDLAGGCPTQTGMDLEREDSFDSAKRRHFKARC